MLPKYVSVWKDCSAGISVAVERFNERSRPFSLASRQYSFLRLIREELDVAVAEYRSQLDQKYLLFQVPGLSATEPFSAVIRNNGFRVTGDVIRKTLRRFVDSSECVFSDADKTFIDTAETLLEVLIFCRSKQPQKRKNAGAKFNLQRPREFCRFCGQPSEYMQFINNPYTWNSLDEEQKVRLSHKYCHAHRPKLQDGTWNNEYRKAMRSKKKFEIETNRLLKQSAQPGALKQHADDASINRYIMYLIAQTTLQPADEDKIRDLARRLVNYRISDRKKQIIMLMTLGYSQAEIARRLGVERQAVWKALKSIPDEFRLDVS